MSTGPYSLVVPADPAQSLTVRRFIAEAGAAVDLDTDTIDDLRLVATELLGAAVDAHGDTLTLSLSREGLDWRLDALGVGSLEGGGGGVVDRRDVLRALARVEDGDDGAVVVGPHGDDGA